MPGLVPALSLEVAAVALPQGTHLSSSTRLIYKNQSSPPGRSGTQLLLPHDMPFSGVWNSTWWRTTKGTTWEAEFSFARARGAGKQLWPASQLWGCQGAQGGCGVWPPIVADL